MKVTIDKKTNKAIVELDLLTTPRTSGTGNTVNLAECRNQHTGLVHDGKELKVTAALYWPVPKSERPQKD